MCARGTSIILQQGEVSHAKVSPDTYFHQPSPTLERLHSLQHITTDWGPKLGSYQPMRGHLRFRFKGIWLETSSTETCAKWNFKRSALCDHAILHFTMEASVKYMMTITVLGWTEMEKGGKRANLSGRFSNNVVVNNQSNYSDGRGNGTDGPDVKGSTFHISEELTGRWVRLGRPQT